MSSILGQLGQQMAQGIPEPLQFDGSSPNANPSLVSPPSQPMPEKSPASEIKETALHRALKRRNIDPASIPQLNSQTPVSINPNAPQALAQGQPMPASEAELIIKALTTRLKTLGEHESAVRDHLFPKGEKK